MMRPQDVERLRQFFGGYFNQDWDLNGPTWQDVVLVFVKDNSRESALNVLNAIRSWLQSAASNAEIARELQDSFWCEYSAQSDGITDRQWVEQVAEFIASHVGA
jgi:hypothetical protein